MGMMIIRHKIRDYGHWRPSWATPQCRRGRALPIRACSTQLIAIRAKSWWSSIRRTPRRQKLLLLRQISKKRWQKPVSWIHPRSISLNQ
jgi:hypothetical protein